MSEYFTREEAELFTFFRIPKELFRNPKYKSINTDAKVLYGLLLDRNSLSRKNGWFDERGYVYIYFSREEAAEELSLTTRTVIKLFAELRKVGLIEEVKQGLTKPNIIFVKKFVHSHPLNGSEFQPQNPHKSTEVKNFHFKEGKIFTSEHEKFSLQNMKNFHPSYTYSNQTLPEKELHQSVSPSQKVDLTAPTVPDKQTDGLTDLYQKVQIDLFTDKSLQHILKGIIKELYTTNPSQTENLALSHIDEALARFRHAEEEQHIKNPRGYFKKCLLSAMEELGLQNVGYELPEQPQEVLQDRDKKEDEAVVASSFQLEPQKQQLPLEKIEDNIRGLRHILSQSRMT